MPAKKQETEKKEPEKKEKPSNYLFWENKACDDESEFCSKLNDFVDTHPVVNKYHGKWKQIIEWVEGNQYTFWDERKGLLPVELRKRKKTVVINIMKPLNEAIEGKLNVNTSVVGVPNSGEQADIKGSEVASRLIAHNDYINGIENIMDDVVYDLLHPGTACTCWNYDKDHPGGYINGAKKGSDKVKRVSEPGEVVGRVVPIFNIRPDTLAKNPDELHFVAEIMEMGREEVQQSFPNATNDILDTMEADEHERLRGTNVPQDERGDVTSYRVIVFFERKSKRFPNGRYMATLGERVIHSGPNPIPDADLPYIFWYYKKSPYSFWGRSPAYYILDIQRELNRTVSLISEHIESWRPKMAVPIGSVARAEAFTVDSFELIEIDPTRGTPTAITMPQLSQQVLEYRDFLISSMDKVSNVHEVSYSRLPQYASRAPASLYSMMLEQENIKLSSMVKKMNKSLVDQAKLRLKLMGKHYKFPRMTRIMGKQRSAAVQYFDAGDLNGNYDVKLEVGVTMNQSTTVQVRLLMELWEKGFFKDNDRNKILQALNMGTAERELRNDVADMEKAMRENQAFLDGKSSELPIYQNLVAPGGQALPSILYIHDDHELHLEYHTDLMKSEEYADMDEKEQEALNKHITEHFILYQALMMRGQGVQATPGQPGGQMATSSPQPQNIPGRPGVPGPTPEAAPPVTM